MTVRCTPDSEWTIFSTASDEPVHLRTNKPRSEHYKWLSSQFKSDGCDDYAVVKFLRQELLDELYTQGAEPTAEQREYASAIAEWWSWEDDRRDFYLSNAFCSKCGGKTEFDFPSVRFQTTAFQAHFEKNNCSLTCSVIHLRVS